MGELPNLVPMARLVPGDRVLIQWNPHSDDLRPDELVELLSTEFPGVRFTVIESPTVTVQHAQETTDASE